MNILIWLGILSAVIIIGIAIGTKIKNYKVKMFLLYLVIISIIAIEIIVLLNLKIIFEQICELI